MKNEQDQIKLLRLVDWAIKDLEREIRNLPKSLVWKCNSRDEIKSLKEHFEQAIEDWRKRLPGTSGFERKHFLGLIEVGERELKDIHSILSAIGDMDEDESKYKGISIRSD